MIPQSIQKQLDDLCTRASELAAKTTYRDWSDLTDTESTQFVTSVKATVWRVTGKRSAYAEQVEQIIESNPFVQATAQDAAGIIRALRDDVAGGYLTTLEELAHADIFADYLEMAEHLQSTGYKDAAAVIAGSTLESHVRMLATKNGLPITHIDGRGRTVPKKADSLNSDLKGAGVYGKLDQKNVTAWLDLRNKAAHGDYSAYTADQVRLTITSIRDFITRHPA